MQSPYCKSHTDLYLVGHNHNAYATNLDCVKCLEEKRLAKERLKNKEDGRGWYTNAEIQMRRQQEADKNKKLSDWNNSNYSLKMRDPELLHTKTLYTDMVMKQDLDVVYNSKAEAAEVVKREAHGQLVFAELEVMNRLFQERMAEMNDKFKQDLDAEFQIQNELMAAGTLKPNFTPIRHPQPSVNVDNQLICGIYGCSAGPFSNEKQLKYHWDMDCLAYPMVCETCEEKVVRQNMGFHDCKTSILKQIQQVKDEIRKMGNKTPSAASNQA